MGYPIGVPHWCIYCCTPKKIKTGTSCRKRIKQQDSRFEKGRTYRESMYRDYEFRRIKGNFVEESFVDFCFLDHTLFANAGFLSIFEIYKGVFSKYLSKFSDSV